MLQILTLFEDAVDFFRFAKGQLSLHMQSVLTAEVKYSFCVLLQDKFMFGAPGFNEAAAGFGIRVPVDVLHPIPLMGSPQKPLYPSVFPTEQRHFPQALIHPFPSGPIPFGLQVAQMAPPSMPMQMNQPLLRAAPSMRAVNAVPPGFNFRGAGNTLFRPAVDARERTASTDEVLAAVATAEVKSRLDTSAINMVRKRCLSPLSFECLVPS